MINGGNALCGEPPDKKASTLPVAKILGGQTSNSEISHDRKNITTVQPLFDHTLPPESIIAQNTDSSDDDKYTASTDDDSHEHTLEYRDITSEDDELEYPHCANLPSYLHKDARNQDDFKINDVCKEENEIFDCDSDIDRYEIDDLHYMSAVAKEIKDRYKEEEEDSVIDDMWRNGVLIEKSGDPTISRFMEYRDITSGDDELEYPHCAIITC